MFALLGHKTFHSSLFLFDSFAAAGHVEICRFKTKAVEKPRCSGILNNAYEMYICSTSCSIIYTERCWCNSLTKNRQFTMDKNHLFIVDKLTTDI